MNSGSPSFPSLSSTNDFWIDTEAIDTYAACLTPRGLAAVSVWQLSGLRSEEIVARCFMPAGKKGVLLENRIRYGTWRFDDDAIEEQVVVCRLAPHIFEINCHGGEAISQWLEKGLTSLGVSIVTGNEIAPPLPAVFAHEPTDAHNVSPTIESEAFAHLLQAKTIRSTAILLDQWRGALRRELTQIDDALKQLLVSSAAQGAVVEKLQKLMSWMPLGLHLIDPWKITLAGPPNAGKSSLINALLGYQRAIVHHSPGTTRDRLRCMTAFDGWHMELSDTAGIRAAAEDIEQLGVQIAENAVRESDLVLLVVAPEDGWTTTHTECWEAARRAIVVLSKCDQVDVNAWLAAFRYQLPADPICVSSHTGEGLPALISASVDRLIPSLPPPGNPISFTSNQFDAIERALRATVAGDVDAARKEIQSLLNP